MDLRSLFRAFTDPVLDFIYPPVCISCQTSLPDAKHRVCRDCWDSMARLSINHPLFLETKGKLVAGGIVNDLVSAFVFEKEGAFQHIAHALKYSGYESVGRDLGAGLGKTMIEWGIKADLVIPIPLHKAKHRERGYNQAESIARGVASVTGIKVLPSAVSRVKHTQTQTQLNIEERRKNVEDAFELNASQVRFVQNKTCLLLDDVITTGATVNACARELVKGGASRIIAASAALAQ